MEFLILWLFCAVACYFLAESKGRSAGAWAVAGLLFGIFALVICAVMPKKQRLSSPRQSNQSPTFGSPQYGAPPPPPQYGAPSDNQN